MNVLFAQTGVDLGGTLVPPDPNVAIGVTNEPISVTAMELLNGYAPVFLVAFAVTLFSTPIVRRLAVAAGIIDHPDDPRKIHAYPVAYLGGVAVFLGLIIALTLSYQMQDTLGLRPVPIAVIVGMIAIMFTGLADDIWGWDPRLKIAGQLVAAAALAIEDVGVRVADGLLTPLMGPSDETLFMLFDVAVPNGALYYWVGTAIIAIFVLGGCNAANLIDGLDGLLAGVLTIVAVGLLCIALFMAIKSPGTDATAADSLNGARIVLCLALLGAVLGFLPHNFNPATIFLGDCGSLLLGYVSVVIILMFGEQGQTHLVFAGLIIFALPIMDTVLAIIRRVLAGTSLSTADNHHLHHQLKRALGGVRTAVVAMYGISFLFAVIGVLMAALVMFTELRVRVVYTMAFVLFSSIGVIAVKEARRQQLQIARTKTKTKSKAAASRSSAQSKSNAPQQESTDVDGGETAATSPKQTSG